MRAGGREQGREGTGTRGAGHKRGSRVLYIGERAGVRSGCIYMASVRRVGGAEMFGELVGAKSGGRFGAGVFGFCSGVVGIDFFIDL